jgi:hypothetical protein
VVRNEKELAKAAAELPASRLVEIWNSFAWRRAVQRLQGDGRMDCTRAGIRRDPSHQRKTTVKPA